MLGRTNTGGGGSGGLNFQVIGGTAAPSNPKENMIWVNTSTKITSYIFSTKQPTGSDGMVWIATGTSCTVEFNALKKNCIQVCPAAAKQYVNGIWVDKVAKSYKSGAWTDWSVELYPPSSNWNAATNGQGYAGISDEGIELQEKWISYPQYQQVTTKTKWNVTPYKKLCARMKSSGTGCTKVLALSTVADSNVLYGSFVAKTTNATQTAGTVLECDISSISGEYYVVVGQYTNNGASNSSTVFDDVWME